MTARPGRVQRVPVQQVVGPVTTLSRGARVAVTSDYSRHTPGKAVTTVSPSSRCTRAVVAAECSRRAPGKVSRVGYPTARPYSSVITGGPLLVRRIVAGVGYSAPSLASAVQPISPSPSKGCSAPRAPAVIQRTVQRANYVAQSTPQGTRGTRSSKQEPHPTELISVREQHQRHQQRWLSQWQQQREQEQAESQQHQKRLQRQQQPRQEKELQARAIAQQGNPAQPQQRLQLRRELQKEAESTAHCELSPVREKPDRSDVMAFLEKCGLEQYASAVVAGGFDTLDILLEINDADLKDLGFPRGHAIKLQRHIRESKGLSADLELALAPKSSPVSSIGGAGMALPTDALCFYDTDEIKTDVMKSWEKILEIGILYAGEVLYKKMFLLNPALREKLAPSVLAKYHVLNETEMEPLQLENDTLSRMAAKIFNAVGCAITGLHDQDLSTLVPLYHSLGMRHMYYSAPEASWEVLGRAVNLSLNELLGEVFSPDVEHVWTVGYKFISAIMIQGMREANAETAEMQLLLSAGGA